MKLAEEKKEKLKKAELTRIKKWEDNLKRKKKEALMEQAGLKGKSEEAVGWKNIVAGGKKSSDGKGKGNKSTKEKKRDSQARTVKSRHLQRFCPACKAPM